MMHSTKDALHALQRLQDRGGGPLPASWAGAEVPAWDWRVLAHEGLVRYRDAEGQVLDAIARPDVTGDTVEIATLGRHALSLDATSGPTVLPAAPRDQIAALASRALLHGWGVPVRDLRYFNGTALWTIAIGKADVAEQTVTRHYETAAWYRSYEVPAQSGREVRLVVLVSARAGKLALAQGDGTQGTRPFAVADATLVSGCLRSSFGGVPFGRDPIEAEIGRPWGLHVPVRYEQVDELIVQVLGNAPGSAVEIVPRRLLRRCVSCGEKRPTRHCGGCGEGPLCPSCLPRCEQRCARALREEEEAAERWSDEGDA